MLKIATLTVVAVAVATMLAVPASARSCDDYAWDSQAMRDCHAHADQMRDRARGHHKRMRHEDMKNMKDMKHDRDMKDMKHDRT